MRLLDPLGGMKVVVVPSWEVEYQYPRKHWWQLWRPRMRVVTKEPDHCLVMGSTVMCTARQKEEIDRRLSPLCAIYDGECPEGP